MIIAPPSNIYNTNSYTLNNTRMATYTDSFWVFDDDNTPCRCCSPMDAIENNFWNCKERRWYIVDSYFPLEHSSATCEGSCGNPFHAPFLRELHCSELSGYGWGDVQYEWEHDAYNRLSSAEKAAKFSAEAAEKAEDAHLKPLIAEHHAQVDRMRRCRQIAGEKRNKGRKEAAPCRSLYDYQREGGCQTLHISTECWAHEFTDSLSCEIIDEKTGQPKMMADKLGIRNALTAKECGIFRLKDGRHVLKWMPHVCYMSHPGDVTWIPEWNQNRNAGRDSRGPRSDTRSSNQHGSDTRRNGPDILRNWRGADPRGSNQQGPPPSQLSNNRFANLDSAW